MTRTLPKIEWPRYVAGLTGDDIYVDRRDAPGESEIVLRISPQALMDLIRVKADIKGLHQRKCWPCQVVHWHATDHGPMVACPVCGSMDTRRIKETP